MQVQQGKTAEQVEQGMEHEQVATAWAGFLRKHVADETGMEQAEQGMLHEQVEQGNDAEPPAWAAELDQPAQRSPGFCQAFASAKPVRIQCETNAKPQCETFPVL